MTSALTRTAATLAALTLVGTSLAGCTGGKAKGPTAEIMKQHFDAIVAENHAQAIHEISVEVVPAGGTDTSDFKKKDGAASMLVAYTSSDFKGFQGRLAYDHKEPGKTTYDIANVYVAVPQSATMPLEKADVIGLFNRAQAKAAECPHGAKAHVMATLGGHIVETVACAAQAGTATKVFEASFDGKPWANTPGDANRATALLKTTETLMGGPVQATELFFGSQAIQPTDIADDKTSEGWYVFAQGKPGQLTDEGKQCDQWRIRFDLDWGVRSNLMPMVTCDLTGADLPKFDLAQVKPEVLERIRKTINPSEPRAVTIEVRQGDKGTVLTAGIRTNPSVKPQKFDLTGTKIA